MPEIWLGSGYNKFSFFNVLHIEIIFGCIMVYVFKFDSNYFALP